MSAAQLITRGLGSFGSIGTLITGGFNPGDFPGWDSFDYSWTHGLAPLFCIAFSDTNTPEN